SWVIGNVIEKGPSDLSSSVVGYLLGGSSSGNPNSELYVVNNTLVNDRASAATFLNISPVDPTPAVVMNNIFAGAGAVSTQANAALTSNFSGSPLFVNQAAYDYHLASGSPAINTGTIPGAAGGMSLMPAYEYLAPSCGETRNLVGGMDIGAYEFGGAGSPM